MMDEIINRSFAAKILLFGEYTVISGSEALAVPFRRYSGKWVMGKPNNASLPFIQGLKNYLLNAYYKGVIEGIDFDLWERAIGNGLHFESDIPVGCGLGSSGALTAAVYHAFVNVTEDLSPSDLKMQLAFIESYFHGTSSGIDPLVSYLDTGVKVRKEEIETYAIRENVSNHFIRLVDSGLERSTGPLVKHFMESLKEEDFNTGIVKLSDLVSLGITQYLGGEQDSLETIWKQISALQFELFESMIPEKIQPVWKSGLDSDNYYFKLCGAGGGGYFLLWKKDPETALDFEKDWKTLSIT